MIKTRVFTTRVVFMIELRRDRFGYRCYRLEVKDIVLQKVSGFQKVNFFQ